MVYEKSHPWIRFMLQVEPSALKFWLKMGEVASKCEHLSGVPLRPEVAKELNSVFLAKGVLATTAIEGNTLSEEQVRKQVDGQLQVPPSQEYLKQEIENIITVCNEEVRVQLENEENKMSLCTELIRSYNLRVLHNLEVDEDVVPGEWRTHSVGVGSVYRGAPAEDVPYLMDRLCEWLTGPDFQAPEEELKIPFAMIKAVVAHIYLAWIHPFGDGNGRTARLLEFHILFTSGVPLPAAHLLSDHYNRTRTKYYRELDRASKSGGDLMPFLIYAVQGLLDGLRGQIGEVRSHQLDVAWENYVYERFGDKKTSTTQKRRRDFVLELSRFDWVSVAGLEELTPKIARFYSAAGDRMLQRDLNAVADMALVERRYGKVRARKNIIQAFLPARIPGAK